MEKLCGELRQRHPAKYLTLEAPTQKPLVNQFKHLAMSNEMLEIFKENKKEILTFGEDDRLVFDRSIEKCDYIYLEHLAGAEDTEIKWYAGPVKAEATTKYSFCKVRHGRDSVAAGGLVSCRKK
jgi:hypothetical protein